MKEMKSKKEKNRFVGMNKLKNKNNVLYEIKKRERMNL